MSNARKVAFKTPIKAGGRKVSEIEVREPAAGELRGLKLADVLQMDVGAMIRLLPRVTAPALTEDEVAALRPRAFGELAGSVVGFFVTEEELAEAEKA